MVQKRDGLFVLRGLSPYPASQLTVFYIPYGRSKRRAEDLTCIITGCAASASDVPLLVVTYPPLTGTTRHVDAFGASIGIFP